MKKRIVGGILKFMVILEKLKKSLVLRGHESSSLYHGDYDEERDNTSCVAEDVKEGHFVVIAENENESKRFVVPLSYLNHPRFLKLLEHSAEEYGFDQHGAITIPCRATEIQMLLAQP